MQRIPLSDDARKVSELAYDSNGVALWDVFSLVPAVDASREGPPLIISGVTLEDAIAAMEKANATNGPCPLVMWPSWAYWPWDWNPENERVYLELQNQRLWEKVGNVEDPEEDEDDEDMEVNPLQQLSNLVEALGPVVSNVTEQVKQACEDKQKSGIVSESVGMEA